jgi:GrpB-like predicted nucleotidyltransferase (UPF0157 family)
MAVVVEAHNPLWLAEFARVESELQIILKDISIISVEHVGSTSIPGLIAKPVLDIDIIVSPESLPAVRNALAKAGYQDLGEMGVPGRVAFRQPVESRDKEMRRNTYVVLKGSLSLRNHIDLKRILLEDEVLRTEYGTVKQRLVDGGVKDVDEYCRGKNEVILRLLEKAGWSEVDLEEIRKAND